MLQKKKGILSLSRKLLARPNQLQNITEKLLADNSLASEKPVMGVGTINAKISRGKCILGEAIPMQYLGAAFCACSIPVAVLNWGECGSRGREKGIAQPMVSQVLIMCPRTIFLVAVSLERQLCFSSLPDVKAMMQKIETSVMALIVQNQIDSDQFMSPLNVRIQ